MGGLPAPKPSQPPLPALLDELLRRFTGEFEERVRATPHAALGLAQSRNVLRWLHAGPLRLTDLVELTGLSKQAISQQVAQLTSLGYVRSVQHPDDGRARLLQLTAEGRDAQRTVHRIFAEVEEDWREGSDDDEWVGFLSVLSRLAPLEPSPRISPPPGGSSPR